MWPHQTLGLQLMDCDFRPRSPNRPDAQTWLRICGAALNWSRFLIMYFWMFMNCYGRVEFKTLTRSELPPISSVIPMERKKLPHFLRRQLLFTNGEVFFNDAFDRRFFQSTIGCHRGFIFIDSGIGISSSFRIVGAICRCETVSLVLPFPWLSGVMMNKGTSRCSGATPP